MNKTSRKQHKETWNDAYYDSQEQTENELRRLESKQKLVMSFVEEVKLELCDPSRKKRW